MHIDLIIVCTYRIFVIEMKTCSGEIFGGKKNERWMCLKGRNKKTVIPNPLKMNFSRVCALSDLQGIPVAYFQNLVVFPDNCLFKTRMPLNVVRFADTARYIKTFVSPWILKAQVDEIVDAIKAWREVVRDKSWCVKFDIMRRVCGRIIILGVSLLLAAFACRAERPHVFFIHGANVSEEDARVWADTMFKRLYLSGANMDFHAIAWESDIGPSYNYQVNVSNAFETARVIAPRVNSFLGRKIVIAHSLGALVAAAAIQDYGMQVEKLIMLNSAIPSEAFDSLQADYSPQNGLVHDDWVEYTNACWVVRWHEQFSADDARSRLTWRGRFAAIIPFIVNFYSSGDEVLELYSDAHNPAWYNGFSPAGNWGDRYSWHKQEIWKGRKSLLGFIGTTTWSGWGFKENLLGVKVWSAAGANAIQDVTVFATNTVFNPYPASINNPSATRLETDFHLAQGIPALSPATGRTDLSGIGVLSIDMNAPSYKGNTWPRGPSYGDLAFRVLHSDVKNVAYFYVSPIFKKIVEI